MKTKNKSVLLPVLGGLIVLLLAACQGVATPQETPAGQATATLLAEVAPTSTVPPSVTSATEPAPAEAVINVTADPTLGPILVGANGMTLYMFTKDEPDKSNCTDKCLVNWPPLLTQGKPAAGEGLDPALIGTAVLPDGSLIATYNHLPLYYFIMDKAPGDVTGQNSNGVWFVVAPDGNPVGLTNTNANDNTNTNTNSNQNSNDDSGKDNGGGGNDNSNDNGDD